MIYFWLVQSWFRIYVGLVCGLFGFVEDLFRVGSCLFNRCSLGFISGWFMVSLEGWLRAYLRLI